MAMTRDHAASTAADAGLLNCHSCSLLVRRPSAAGRRILRCPRCGACLHPRKPNSITRTWALVIAAAIFYIPANLLPVTITTYLGSTQSDTIMSGVIFFMQTGSWGIALIIFVASIVVPLAKLITLSGLLLYRCSGGPAGVPENAPACIGSRNWWGAGPCWMCSW
jgi:paraquat-inducible protein A